jgi:hypothetical protein
MSNELLIGVVMLGIFGGLFVAGVVRNAARAKRGDERRRSAGALPCGRCQSVGTLSVRTTWSGDASSSNRVRASASCGNSDWKILE